MPAPDATDGGLRERWTWIAIPVCIVVAVAILAMIMTAFRRRMAPPGRRGIWGITRRTQEAGANNAGGSPTTHIVYVGGTRHHQQTFYQYHHHPAGRRDRDLEETLARGFRAGGNQQQQPRQAGRWAWANGRGFGRREEGLNELGEAPPPYMGRRADEEWKPASEGVELVQLPHDDSASTVAAASTPPTRGGGGGSEGGSCSTATTPTTTPLRPPEQPASPAPLPPVPPLARALGTNAPPPMAGSAPGSPPAYTESALANTPGVRTSVVEVSAPETAVLGPERRRSRLDMA